MRRTYYIVTMDWNGHDEPRPCLHDDSPFRSWRAARRAILARWGHYPPFARVTTRTSGLRPF